MSAEAAPTRHYLDHASSSPLRPGALEAMLPYLRDHHADPGRVHTEGLHTRVAIEEAREQVAALAGARPREVVFTSSGTEALNAAVYGALRRADGLTHAVATAVEHSAVLDALDRWADEVTLVPVDSVGRVRPEDVAAAVRPETAVVAVQAANHEVGTVQPVAEAVAACRDLDALTLVDACAAAGHVDVDFAGVGCDLMAVTGHKFGGPKGAAALLVRRGLRLDPFIVGGAQERARRGGIENVPAVVGFGVAAAEAADALGRERSRLRHLTDDLAKRALESAGGVLRYGDADDRLPQIVCLGVDGVEAEPILLGLDQRGVAVHSGSSCASETLEPSPVLEAMSADAEHSLRVSLGWSSTGDDVEAFLDAFPEVVAGLRALRA